MNCPKCNTVSNDDAAYCQNCGAPLQQSAGFRIQSTPRTATLSSLGLAPETLALLLLLLIQAILSFMNASDFSDFSFTNASGVFSAPLWPIFGLFGILELVAAYGIFKKQSWAIVGVAFLDVEGLAFAPGQTIVSILMILLLLYLNRNALSNLTSQRLH